MEDSVSVQLYIYDMTRGMAALMSQMLLGRHIEGVWHTAVVVHGREFFYGGHGITSCMPVSTRKHYQFAKINLDTRTFRLWRIFYAESEMPRCKYTVRHGD